MKKIFVFALALGSMVSLFSCKSSETAYRKAYEKAKMQNSANASDSVATVAVTTTTTTTSTTPTIQATPTKEDNSDVRTIAGGVTVVNGTGLKTYSVVVGSFSVQTNAEGLQRTLKAKGYDAQVVRSNETINGITGWYRVVAATFSDKASAVKAREELRSAAFKDPWLLYNK